MTKQNAQLIVAFLLATIVSGCDQNSNTPVHQKDNATPQPQTAVSAAEAKLSPPTDIPELSKRDAEIIRFVLSERDRPGDRIYFLTTTPKKKWSETGGWANLPNQFHESIANLQTKFRLAHEAHLKNYRVLERGTDAEAWMRWITILEWKSETEVTIEDGVWCCPLGGGASTVTYEKIDGKWQFKESGGGWVS